MTWERWWLFAVMEFVLSLTPGPAVLLVVSLGLQRGSLRAAWGSAGILTANALYFVLSGTGLGTLLVASTTVFTAIKWCGSAYLVYLDGCALFSRAPVLAPAEEGTAESADGPKGFGFARGFVVQAANPKALLFFAAILPQFVDPGGSLGLQMAVLGVTSIGVEAVVLLAYGFFSGKAARLAMRPGFSSVTNRTAGAFLIAAGLGLARQHQPG